MAQALLWALLAVCLIRFWVMPMPSGFWVDESVTAFVVAHPHDPSFAFAPQVPQSIYYRLPAASTRLLGDIEVAFRLPSLLLSLLSLWVISCLAARLIHPEAAWMAVFLCLSLRGFNFEAIDARPYALGILTAAASLLFLVRWLDDGRWLDALAFLLTAALLWRVQLIFWPFYLVYALYAAARLRLSDTRVSIQQVFIILVLLGILLVPVAINAYLLFREAKTHVIVDFPRTRDLVQALKLPFIALTLIAIVILRRAWRNSPRTPQPDASSLVLCMAWWLVVPLALFAFSCINGTSVFVSRYLSEALPGIAFALLGIGAAWMPLAAWRPVAAVFGVSILILQGGWTHLWPPHSPSGWREAAAAIQSAGATATTTVLCPSPFIEAQSAVWTPDHPIAFFSCHLLRYAPPGCRIVLPFKPSLEAEQFAHGLIQSSIQPAGKVFIYGGDMNAHFWRDWLLKQPEMRGWRARSLGKFGDVDAVMLEAPHPPTP